MQIHELPEIMSISSGGYFATDNGTQTTKIDYDKLAKAIIEQYSGSTLAGAAQSVQAAIGKLAPQVKTAITDLSTILPGEQGYFQLDSSVSPTGSTAYFTVWCTGNTDRRGIIAIYTVASKTTAYVNAGHATGGVLVWRGWLEVAASDAVDLLYGTGVPSGTFDLNDYYNPGTYFFNGATLANRPSLVTNGYLKLTVSTVTGGVGGTNRQRIQQIDWVTNNDVYRFVRLLRSSDGGGTWTARAWNQINMTAES